MRVAITGAAGQLGGELVRAFGARGDEVLALVRPEFDVTRVRDLDRLAAWNPDVVVNAAAWTDVDGCARDPELAMRINGEAAGAVARAAATAGALVVQVSTNEVFDGSLDRPYTEDDAPHPINPYGASKLAGERLVAAANPRHLIVRTAWLFGPGGTNFVTKILDAAARSREAGQPLRVVADEWGNPTWTPTLADDITVLAESQLHPELVHLAGEPPASRLAWASAFVPTDVAIEPIGMVDFARPSRVPPRAVLAMDKARALGIPPRSWVSELRGLVDSAG